MLDRKLTENLLKGYIVALVYVKPPQIIQAFSGTLNEARFSPPPATLREFSGQTMTGDKQRRCCFGSSRRCVASMDPTSAL
jgi:hypothetical protein